MIELVLSNGMSLLYRGEARSLVRSINDGANVKAETSELHAEDRKEYQVPAAHIAAWRLRGSHS